MNRFQLFFLLFSLDKTNNIFHKNPDLNDLRIVVAVNFKNINQGCLKLPCNLLGVIINNSKGVGITEEKTNCQYVMKDYLRA